MPITIQEIIASDTISQLVDKTNFNFDQLLLNGGGPQGPAGPMGPTGPIGGRGPKGSTWYEDTSVTNPGCTPNVCPPTVSPLAGDYYLQFNGLVWEYNGTIWVATTVSLLGPMGPPGTDGGFGSFFGNPNLFIDRNAVCPTPSGWNNTTNSPEGADLNNEGILTVLIGGVASNIAPVHASIPLTSYYELPDSLALQLESPFVSLMVHQKNATSRAIMLHGGQPGTGLNPEQYSDIFSDLCNIRLGLDDSLTIDVPKSASAPTGGVWTPNQVLGLRVQSINRGQEYLAGNQITFTTGQNATAYDPVAHSNFEIHVKAGGIGVPANKFSVNVQNEPSQLMNAQFEMGGNVTLINTPPAQIAFNADVQLVGGNINITTSGATAPGTNNIKLISGGSILLEADNYSAGDITGYAGTGGILLDSNAGNVTLLQSNTGTTTSDIIIENRSTNILGTGGNIRVKGNAAIILQSQIDTVFDAPSIALNIDGAGVPPPAGPPHTSFVGGQIWQPISLGIYTPPLSSVEQYNNLVGVLGAGQTFRQTGKLTLNDVVSGANFEAWQGGTNPNMPGGGAGPALGQIRIKMGDEIPPGGFPITAPYVAWDNQMTLSIEDDATADSAFPPKQFFSASEAKIGIAAPFVFKRSADLNSMINHSPLNHKPWGWNTLNNNTSPGGAGYYMPNHTQILCPFVEIGVGPGSGYNAAGQTVGALGWGGVPNGTNYNASNQDTTLLFPVGSYPGQKITLVIKNYASDYIVSFGFSSVNVRYYGDVTLRIPLMRQNRPLTTNNWTSWWEHSGGAPVNGSFEKVVVWGSSSGADCGEISGKFIEMTWDGSTDELNYRTSCMPGASNSERGMRVQWGWRINYIRSFYTDTNLGNTGGGGTITSTISVPTGPS